MQMTRDKSIHIDVYVVHEVYVYRRFWDVLAQSILLNKICFCRSLSKDFNQGFSFGGKPPNEIKCKVGILFY